MTTLRAALDALPMPNVQVWCETCEGSGSVYQEPQKGCHVGGNYPCPDCDGNGWFLATLSVRAAHRDGARLTLEQAVTLCDVLRDHYASQNRPATEDAMLFAGICDYADALRAQLKELHD